MLRSAAIPCVIFSFVQSLDAFSPPTRATFLEASTLATTIYPSPRSAVLLEASPKKKKRRRRKKQPGLSGTVTSPTPPAEAVEAETVVAEEIVVEEKVIVEDEAAEETVVVEEVDVEAKVQVASTNAENSMPKDLKDVANFKFDPDAKMTFEAEDLEGFQDDGQSTDSEIIKEAASLPDMKDLKKTKELEKALAKLEEEKLASKPKIKRSDTKAFIKLLEANPYADADDSFFEQEEYGTVEALLGERAKPFLGIPFPLLQVGHFVGALGIALMAYVEYPGFPLTNLPTPLRNCFQGGLLTVYAINAVLAVLAVFKAGERGQNPVLWGVKTFSVGGLAYDQLTQLPTTEQVEKAKVQKGKRALKNRGR